jgi:hypothetical protein
LPVATALKLQGVERIISIDRLACFAINPMRLSWGRD